MLLAHDDRHILDWHIEHQAWANASDMSWSKQRPLVAAEDVELGLVDSRPVTLENTPCISRVGVPAPIGVADAMLAEVAHERRLPGGLRTIDHRPAEFAEVDRGEMFCLEVAPILR